MSDGITEARRGTYFSGGSRYAPLTPPYEIEDKKYMPNQKWHRYVSFIKSGFRILGYALIPFSLVTATIILIFSEIIGVVEELV